LLSFPTRRASDLSKINGTTSNALKVAPIAITGVEVPEKYIWCNVPGTPPSRNKEAATRLAAVALRLVTKPMVANIKAKDTVAKTSKKPSTHRCTTHQRQYSIMVICVRSP